LAGWTPRRAAKATPLVAGVDQHGQNLVIAGGLFVNNGFVADSNSTPGSVIVDVGALYKGAGTNFVPIVTQNGSSPRRRRPEIRYWAADRLGLWHPHPHQDAVLVQSACPRARKSHMLLTECLLVQPFVAWLS
jgi:hypothetical protein